MFTVTIIYTKKGYTMYFSSPKHVQKLKIIINYFDSKNILTACLMPVIFKHKG